MAGSACLSSAIRTCLGGIAFRSSSLEYSPVDGFSEVVHLPLPLSPIQLSVDPVQAGCGPFLSVNPLFKRKLTLHFYWQEILILIFFLFFLLTHVIKMCYYKFLLVRFLRSVFLCKTQDLSLHSVTSPLF